MGGWFAMQAVRQFFTTEIWPVALPVLWSVGITILLSGLFWIARWYWLTRWAAPPQRSVGSVLYVSFGTELFALLVAVDLSVVLGLVEIWRLGSGEFPPMYDRIVAAIMLPLTCYLSAVGLIWERQAFQAWGETRSQELPVSRRWNGVHI